MFPDESEATRIISGLRWIGLFSNEKVKPRAGNLLDTLCAQLETLMKYEDGERDLVMLQHKFIIEWADGKTASLYRIFLSPEADSFVSYRIPSLRPWKLMASPVATLRWPSLLVYPVVLPPSLFWTASSILQESSHPTPRKFVTPSVRSSNLRVSLS